MHLISEKWLNQKDKKIEWSKSRREIEKKILMKVEPWPGEKHPSWRYLEGGSQSKASMVIKEEPRKKKKEVKRWRRTVWKMGWPRAHVPNQAGFSCRRQLASQGSTASSLYRLYLYRFHCHIHETYKLSIKTFKNRFRMNIKTGLYDSKSMNIYDSVLYFQQNIMQLSAFFQTL